MLFYREKKAAPTGWETALSQHATPAANNLSGVDLAAQTPLMKPPQLRKPPVNTLLTNPPSASGRMQPKPAQPKMPITQFPNIPRGAAPNSPPPSSLASKPAPTLPTQMRAGRTTQIPQQSQLPQFPQYNDTGNSVVKRLTDMPSEMADKIDSFRRNPIVGLVGEDDSLSKRVLEAINFGDLNRLRGVTDGKGIMELLSVR